MCVQVEVLWTSVFCWMVSERGVATVSIIHFVPLMCFSRCLRVGAFAMVHIMQIMIDRVLSRSLFFFLLIGVGVSGGVGLFFSMLCSCPHVAASWYLPLVPSLYLSFVPSFVWGTSDFWWPPFLTLCLLFSSLALFDGILVCHVLGPPRGCGTLVFLMLFLLCPGFAPGPEKTLLTSSLAYPLVLCLLFWRVSVWLWSPSS